MLYLNVPQTPPARHKCLPDKGVLLDQFTVLKQYFGYTEFREGQEYLIEQILAGKDAVGIMPTGAGKSICFQVPALMMPGITLVVSPLISLMRDQVMALKTAGVPAAFLNSSLSANQYALAVSNMKQGLYKIIYIAPERLLQAGFLEALQGLHISLLAIDEAHCISQWGQDFRPSYTQIPAFLAALPQRPVVAAFTATATQQVKEDIISQLELEDFAQLVTGFDRSNLFFEVCAPQDKKAEVLRRLDAHKGECGIIYCSTRKAVAEVCEFLQRSGCEATRYHAGLSAEERKENQEAFLYDRAQVMVATNAFGMGIDKSNVRFVIHYNMPLDLESYYQEAGRAGRDGLRSECVLLYNGQDVMMGKFLLEKGLEETPDETLRAALLARGRARLKTMTFYSTTLQCLRQYILRYFGQQAPAECGACSNCLQAYETVDIARSAHLILDLVERTGQRFGPTMIAEVLRGEESGRIFTWHLDEDEAFGTLGKISKSEIMAQIDCLVQLEALQLIEEKYATLMLGAQAQEVWRAQSIAMKQPVKRKKAGQNPAAAKAAAQSADPVLFERLREERKKFATRESVPAYVVFSDATLQDMCRRLPQTQAEFCQVSGIGTKKAERYSKAFLAVIAEHSARRKGE